VEEPPKEKDGFGHAQEMLNNFFSAGPKLPFAPKMEFLDANKMDFSQLPPLPFQTPAPAPRPLIAPGTVLSPTEGALTQRSKPPTARNLHKEGWDFFAAQQVVWPNNPRSASCVCGLSAAWWPWGALADVRACFSALPCTHTHTHTQANIFKGAAEKVPGMDAANSLRTGVLDSFSTFGKRCVSILSLSPARSLSLALSLARSLSLSLARSLSLSRNLTLSHSLARSLPYIYAYVCAHVSRSEYA
jgi:hypothetical protein